MSFAGCWPRKAWLFHGLRLGHGWVEIPSPPSTGPISPLLGCHRWKSLPKPPRRSARTLKPPNPIAIRALRAPQPCRRTAKPITPGVAVRNQPETATEIDPRSWDYTRPARCGPEPLPVRWKDGNRGLRGPNTLARPAVPFRRLGPRGTSPVSADRLSPASEAVARRARDQPALP